MGLGACLKLTLTTTQYQCDSLPASQLSWGVQHSVATAREAPTQIDKMTLMTADPVLGDRIPRHRRRRRLRHCRRCHRRRRRRRCRRWLFLASG